jgi:hypothetical protein
MWGIAKVDGVVGQSPFWDEPRSNELTMKQTATFEDQNSTVASTWMVVVPVVVVVVAEQVMTPLDLLGDEFVGVPDAR